MRTFGWLCIVAGIVLAVSTWIYVRQEHAHRTLAIERAGEECQDFPARDAFNAELAERMRQTAARLKKYGIEPGPEITFRTSRDECRDRAKLAALTRSLDPVNPMPGLLTAVGVAGFGILLLALRPPRPP